MDGVTPRRNRWDLTPAGSKMGTPSADRSTPSRFSRTNFGETPTPGRWGAMQPTPMRMMQETPTPGNNRFGATPMAGSTTRWDQKPGATPT
eukprot:CAMPEP_0202961390 /NCGR_PEP_ID=MMETSP1396-20130829/5440_1 /ASSEMBLY_ACC=CAM_ASM_000872 /TAXON_ID= /ORGANISM="Pseudokeronopsis sp., Strain Brazil" /LENGTH=90 /DNA_ID=CAMNT_0049681161 /DNA_START=244 /DNA_END=516 /DNA_ORIENTATION=-